VVEIPMVEKLFRTLILMVCLFCGFGMPAQTQANAYDGAVPFYVWDQQILYLENDRLNTKQDKTSWTRAGSEGSWWSSNFRNFHYDGRFYRKLSPWEVEQFSAMPEIMVERNKLYFGGREIKFWRRKYSSGGVQQVKPKLKHVFAAHYWNGGIIVVGELTVPDIPLLKYPMEHVGFINLQTGECVFSRLWEKSNWSRLPSFMVPVTINMENKDIVVELKMPPKISLNERPEIEISLTNVSEKTLFIPEKLHEGLGIYHAGNAKMPDLSEKPGNRLVPLRPSETTSETVFLDSSFISLYSLEKGRSVIFYWDGLLNPNDKSEISRFLFDNKQTEITDIDPYTINTTNKDLAFDVKVPKKVFLLDKVDCIVSLTNKSDRPILVPDSLLSLLRPRWRAPQKLLVEPSAYTPLMPSETRQSVLTVKAIDLAYGDSEYSSFMVEKSVKERISFTFDIFLYPDDKSELTRYMCERRIKITK
jgi:hypothetical protein